MTKESLEKHFGKCWYEQLKMYLESKEFSNLGRQIATLRLTKTIYPSKELIFKTFRVIPFDKIKVVLYGQEPYFKKEEENDGLAFSNSLSNEISPILSHILQEVDNEYPEWIEDIGYGRLDKQDLTRWCNQGVMLLNVSLTVEKGFPTSHSSYWAKFTTTVIEALNTKNELIHVFFGKESQKFTKFVTNKTHTVINCIHPGAETFTKNVGFFGSNVFKRVNEELELRNMNIIQW